MQEKIKELPDKYYSKVNKKLNSVNERLTKKSEKYLKKLQKREARLQSKLQKIDSLAANNLFTKTKKKYGEFKDQITGKLKGSKSGIREYIPNIDSLGTSLKFLNQAGSLTGKASESLKSLQQLQDKLQVSGKIKEYIASRKEQIKQVLSKYTKLPGGIKKQYEKLNKTAYYYSSQVKEYKEMLKDPSKIEKKALSLLNKLPAFQKFMKKNSQLASLFRLPDAGNNPDGNTQSLAGLQTRAQVQGMIQQRLSAGGPNAQQILQQNMSQAKGELDKLKDKLNKYGGNGGSADMPDFKPNSQKTKAFLQRLEYGANVQFAKSNKYFPSTGDLGLSVGYKLNDKSIIGIGMSYKMGMGTIRHIAITHQGIGLRTYADYKIKKSIYLSGGYEMNYNAQFKNIEQLKGLNNWQRSGLIGLSKKYKISKKVKGEMKLLYDFMANTHKPASQPFVYRLGYKF